MSRRQVEQTQRDSRRLFPASIGRMLGIGCAGVVLFATTWAMAQNGPLEGGAGTSAAGNPTGSVQAGPPVIGSTPPGRPALAPSTNGPGLAPPSAIGPGPSAAPSTGNAPLQDPHSTAPVTAPPLAPPSATVPNVGAPIPAESPAAKPAPTTAPTGPSALPNPADADSLPPLPPPVALPAMPKGPENSDGGIPPNTFGHLGITVVPTANEDGVVVTGIDRTSPAYPAGLLIGDQITAINGKRIAKFDDLVKGLRAAAQGDGNVALLVRRRGTVDTINVMVGGKMAQTERPRLGLTLDDSNGQLLVLEVTPKSPAAVAGVQVGDEIITVNDYPVSTFDLFVGQIQAMGLAGGQIPLGIRRQGKMITLQATLRGSQPPAMPKSELPKAELPKAEFPKAELPPSEPSGGK